MMQIKEITNEKELNGWIEFMKRGLIPDFLNRKKIFFEIDIESRKAERRSGDVAVRCEPTGKVCFCFRSLAACNTKAEKGGDKR